MAFEQGCIFLWRRLSDEFNEHLIDVTGRCPRCCWNISKPRWEETLSCLSCLYTKQYWLVAHYFV